VPSAVLTPISGYLLRQLRGNNSSACIAVSIRFRGWRFASQKHEFEALMVVKGLAAVAAVLFWLCPLRTGTQIPWVSRQLLFFYFAMYCCLNWTETYVAKEPTGYWPKPPEWNTPAKANDSVPNRTAGEPKH